MGVADNLRQRMMRLNRGDLRALVVCVLISATIWILRTLTEDATDIVRVPIEFLLTQEDVVLLEQDPAFIELELTASGFGILGQRYFKRERAIELTLDEDRISKGALPSSILRNELLRLAGNDREIVDIRPDSLHFTVSGFETRVVPVKTSFKEVNSTERFIVSAPTASPNEIAVRGPKLVLDSLSAIYTETQTLLGEGELFAALQMPEHFTSATDSVLISWKFDRWENDRLTLPITSPPLSKHEAASFFPDSVTVAFIAAASMVGTFSSDDFKVAVDSDNLDSIAHAGKQRVNLRLEAFPEGVRDLSIDPGRVEFLLFRKGD